jgi:hypothetical protein
MSRFVEERCRIAELADLECSVTDHNEFVLLEE